MDSATNLINSLFFDPKRYDLARVGRYKFNKKLAIARRITGLEAAEDITHPYTGEILVEKDGVISREKALDIQDAGVNAVMIRTPRAAR